MPQKLTQEAFLKRCIEVHGNQYDYSKARYNTKDKPVIIICPIHGEFEQTPNNHWKGKGCWKCAGVKPLTQEEFVEKSNAVHSNKYDYSKSVYIRNNIKVTITCPEHGDFEQIPMTHMKGVGCPACANIARSDALLGSDTERVKKIRQTCMSRYGVLNPMLAPGALDNLRKTCMERYGVDNYRKTEECNQKAYLSRKKHGTFNTSGPEEKAYVLLCQKYGTNDVVRQYKSEVYPFACDFYIKSLDLYIELNISWTHGRHFYDENNEADSKMMNMWIEKAKHSKYYAQAIRTWGIKDLEKRDCAKRNGLNYLVFWKEDLSDFMDWFESDKSLEI